MATKSTNTSTSSEFEDLEAEFLELIQNYKNKKATVYEPCTKDNKVECLIGLTEELGLLNIRYLFNPHVDMEKDNINPDALVTLINAVWTILHFYKDLTQKTERLTEQNQTLEQNNKKLNEAVDGLNKKLNTEKNEARACVATAQRISERSESVVSNMLEMKVKLARLTKQKASNEKALQIEIQHLQNENEKLLNKLRNKSGGLKSCDCNPTHSNLAEREKRLKELNSQLQTHNHKLLQEVIALKENMLISGISEFNIGNNNNV